MSILIRSVTIDCADTYELAKFWGAVTNRPMNDDDFPGDPVCAVKPPDGSFPQRILYEVLPPGDPRGDPGERQGGPPSVQVPEAKSVKNRVHLDIAPDFGTLVEEVERIVALGATVVVDRRRPDGTGWFVLSDPEGNEFCESGPAERAAARAAAQA